MTISVERIVHSMIHAELCDGSGFAVVSNAEIISLDSPEKLRLALIRAKDYIELIPCSDVARLKPDLIDKHLEHSPRREIARACKQLFTMKVPHGHRKWGIGLRPRIQDMILTKTHTIIDILLENIFEASRYYKKIGYFEMEFSRYVGYLVSAALQILPSIKEDIRRIYNEIWVRREKDRLFPTNRSPKSQESFHNYCLDNISRLDLVKRPLPTTTLTPMEASAFNEIQILHWRPDILINGKITSSTQQIIYRAFIGIQKMAKGRTGKESQEVNDTILYIVNDVEITQYWLDIFNREFNIPQQVTCHDWSRLEDVNQETVVDLITELFEELKRDEKRIELQLAFLRLLLPLIEPWILCVLLERKLNKRSISRHISTGLKDYEEYLNDFRPELLDTFHKLKKFARGRK